ncbi:MAG: phosphocholine cytidylyltransferase family protein [Gammaproteobacteria bacterium]|nr:phosphocholine cytidylyltransferase family protein [Gammaproteobacteria bacterium]
MYMIVLAAGRGTRLSPLTDASPKCLVKVGDRALLDWQLQVARESDIRDIAIVRGHMHSEINHRDVTYFENPAYDTTNMVETLWCAESVFANGFIVSYGDIIYESTVLQRLLDAQHSVSVVIDQGWQTYWEQRFDNVLLDAETLQVDAVGRISSIGQQPESMGQINGQYIGLMAFRAEGVAVLRAVYEQARQEAGNGRHPLRGQRLFHELYMTDIIQGIIDTGFPVHQVPVQRGWLEIDTLIDLKLANRLVKIRDNSLVITQ